MSDIIKKLDNLRRFLLNFDEKFFSEAVNKKAYAADLEEAINLLKEQEAVNPTLIREGKNKRYNDYVCPRCDNEVVYEQNYCSECGVQFLWEGR